MVIERLERRIETLEGKAKPGGPPRMPGLKPKSGSRPPKPKQPRKQRRHGFARPRMTATHRVEHMVESCPDCGTHLSGGWTQRTREVIDLPVVPVQVAEHVFIARTCPACRRRCLPQAELDGVVVGRQRLGVNLLSLDYHAAGRRAAAHTDHPVVSTHRASTASQRGGHRRGHSSDGAKGPTGGGRDCGPHPRQPGGSRRRNRLA